MAVAQQIGQFKQRISHTGVPLADATKLTEPVEEGKTDADQRQGKLLRQIAGVRVSHQQIGGLVAQQLLQILKIPRHDLLDRQLAQAGVAGGGDQRAGLHPWLRAKSHHAASRSPSAAIAMRWP